MTTKEIPMPNNHCGRSSCMCSHTGGCDRGFINLEDENGRELGRVSPCPMCKGELESIIREAGDFETKRRLLDEKAERDRLVRVSSRA